MSVLTTKALGQVEVGPGELIRFPDGLFGFPRAHDFAVLAEKGDSPFLWLQCASDPELAFIVIEPDLFMRNYVPQLAPGDLDPLETDTIADCTIYAIVTIPENNPELMTANLQGPILIHKTKQIGRQLISHHGKHHVRVPILEQLEG